MVTAPMRIKATVSPSRLRNRVNRPTEKTPMRGQNTISKMAKTLRRFTRALRVLKAQILFRLVRNFMVDFFQVHGLDHYLSQLRPG